MAPAYSENGPATNGPPSIAELRQVNDLGVTAAISITKDRVEWKKN